ncbi:MAG TPA: 50S ribosomal protein L32 [Amycolatopsis sp.]|nr:50S ribosomal protein L32 [Amycolatopsis sp.]
MAVPKRKKSRSATRSRRARWRAAAPDLVPITVDGERMLVPRRLIGHFQRLTR